MTSRSPAATFAPARRPIRAGDISGAARCRVVLWSVREHEDAYAVVVVQGRGVTDQAVSPFEPYRRRDSIRSVDIVVETGVASPDEDVVGIDCDLVHGERPTRAQVVAAQLPAGGQPRVERVEADRACRCANALAVPVM